MNYVNECATVCNIYYTSPLTIYFSSTKHVILYIHSALGFSEMNNTMVQLHWLSYPIEIQRLLPFVIMYTQQPIEFKIFGSFTSCRESFKNVSSITNDIFTRNILNCTLNFRSRLPTKHFHTLWWFVDSIDLTKIDI